MKHDLDFYYREIAQSVLEPVEIGERVQSFYLRRRPRERCMSTLLVFTPEGIAIMGDLTPTDHGTVSAMGYGLAWFAGELSSSYLAEKFLRRQYIPETMWEQVQWWITQAEEDGEPEVAEAWREVIREDCENSTRVYDIICDSDVLGGYDASEHLSSGCGYVDHQIGWLVAIQRRFRETYWEWVKTQAVPPRKAA